MEMVKGRRATCHMSSSGAFKRHSIHHLLFRHVSLLRVHERLRLPLHHLFVDGIQFNLAVLRWKSSASPFFVSEYAFG
jgi:hypothetical protein